MTKLEKLRAAVEYSTLTGGDDAALETFDLMLKAVNHLDGCQELLYEFPWVYQECKRILKDLK